MTRPKLANWSQYGAISLIGLLVLSESYAPVLLQRRAQRLHQQQSTARSQISTAETFSKAIARPIKLLLFSPIVLSLSFYIAVVYGYSYLLYTTIPALFTQTYGFSQGASGLAFLGVGIGMLAGLAVFGLTSDKILLYQSRIDGNKKPEYRLTIMVPAAVLVPIGLFLYGWSAHYRLHWIVPMIGTAVFGAGFICSFVRSFSISCHLVTISFCRYPG